MRRSALRLVLAWVGLSWAASAPGESTGIVFVDANGNGVQDRGELGRASVAVSNGSDVVRTNVYGRYRLPERPGFIALTCPDQFDCPVPHRRQAGDFPLRSAPNPSEFFFVQISDAQVSESVDDFVGFSLPRKSWLPRNVGARLVLRSLRGALALEEDRIVDGLRRALRPYHPVDGLSSVAIVDAYFSELFAPGSELGRIADAARDSMGEIAALRPTFVVSTGDLVAQSGRGSRAAVQAWLRFYGEITDATGVPFYNTHSAGERTTHENGANGVRAVRVGEQLFQAVYGPSHYSFDHANFHFVALGADSQEWLAADLAAHPNMVFVGLDQPPSHAPTRPALHYALASHKGNTPAESQNGTTTIITGSLAGARWVLPAELQERGYRLFYAKNGQLYHAWKRTGEPLVAFLEDTRPLAPTGVFVGVAVDRYGKFADVELSVDGEPVPFERWGDYFFRVSLPYPAERLVVSATSANGGTTTAELEP